MIGVVVRDGADLGGIATLRKAAVAAGAVVRLVAPHGGLALDLHRAWARADQVMAS